MTALLTQPSSRRALTLIELLSVIVILSLVAGAALVRLGPVQEDVALRSAAAALKELDGRARLHALDGERVKIEYDPERGELTLLMIDSDTILSRERLPNGSQIRITMDGQGEAQVVFDRLGRSPDYQVELVRDGSRMVWQVRGATGSITEGAGER